MPNFYNPSVHLKSDFNMIYNPPNSGSKNYYIILVIWKSSGNNFFGAFKRNRESSPPLAEFVLHLFLSQNSFSIFYYLPNLPYLLICLQG